MEDMMLRTQSNNGRNSRVASSKRNSIKRDNFQKEENNLDFGISDYKEYLKVRKVDFIAEFIVGAEESAQALLDDEERRIQETEDLSLKEKLVKEELERNENLKFQKGSWNSRIIDYLDDIRGRNELAMIEEDNQTFNAQNSFTRNLKLQKGRSFTESKSAEISAVPKLQKRKTFSIIESQSLQDQLENIWLKLKMPLDQRMDMVFFIKIYS